MSSFLKGRGKRLISGVMAFTLAASLFGTAAHAETSNRIPIIVSVDKQTYEPGDEVTVTVSVKNIRGVTATGLASEVIGLDYDPRFLSADDYVTEQDGMRIFNNDAYSLGATLDESAYSLLVPTDFPSEAGNYVPEGYNEVRFRIDANIEPAVLLSDTDLLSFKLKVLGNAPLDADHFISVNPQITYLQEYGDGNIEPYNVAFYPAEVVLATNTPPTDPTQPTNPAPTLVDFRLDTQNTNITVGDVIRIKGIATYSDDSKVEVTKDVEWDSTDYGKALMTKEWLNATGAGTVQITGTYNGLSDSLSFVIAQPQGEVNIEHDFLLSASYLFLNIGDTNDLSAYKRYTNDRLDPLDVTEVEWSSSDPSIAAVSPEGKITAHGAGIAIITADYHGYTRIVTADVSGVPSTNPTNPPKTENGIVLDSTELMPVHDYQQLTASRTFSDGTQDELAASALTWSSSDESIAEVHNGRVTGVSKGVATITAEYNGYKAETGVIVYTPDTDVRYYQVAGVSDFNIVKVGETDKFTATVEYWYNVRPAKDITNDAVWISSDPGIFTVDYGVVTGVSAGSAKLTTVYAGQKFEQWVSVEEQDSSGGGTDPGTGTPPTDPGTGTPTDPGTGTPTDPGNGGSPTVPGTGTPTDPGNGGSPTDPGAGTPSRTETGIVLVPNDKLLLTATNTESIAAYQKFSNDTTEALSAEDLQWSSSNESVATVNGEGFVTGVAKGAAVITAKHNNFEAKINAIVYTPDTGNITEFKIAGASATNTVEVRGTYALTASVTYSDNSQKNVTNDAVWISSNPEVCTVIDGVVTGVSPGAAELKLYYAGKEYNVWVSVIADSTPDEPSGSEPSGGDTSGGNTSGGNNPGGNTGTNTGTTTGTIIGSAADSTTPAQPSIPTGTEVFNTKVVSPEAVVSKVQKLVASATSAASFQEPADVKGNWAAKTIDMFLKLNIIKGYTDGTVKPNQAINRAEFVSILSRIFDVKATGTASFKDVTGNNWAKTAIEQFAAAGIINGYGNGEFRPNQTITREEMVIVLSRLINLESLATDAAKGGFGDLQGAKAADTIQQAAQAGIISGSGDGTFAPDGNATRAEALTIILNALNLNSEIKTMLDTLE